MKIWSCQLPFDYAVRNLGRSRPRLLMSLSGALLVALLVTAAAGFIRGMNTSLAATGDPRNIIILGAGSEESVERSEIGAGVGSLVAAAIPGLHTRLGTPYVSAEVHLAIPLKLAPDGEAKTLSYVRGMTPTALLVHNEVQIVNGRLPTAGHEELMVGPFLAQQLGVPADRVAIGQKLWIDQRPWTIVGHFVAPGTILQSEAWGPLTDLKIAAKRDTDSCIVMRLDTAEFADVDAFCKQRVDLELTALPETAYYDRLSGFFRPIRVVVWATALLIAFGGLLGGLNGMYAAFAARIREIGMLQCLGFRRLAIVLSLIQESLLVSISGALGACVIALWLLNGLSVRFSTGVFGLLIDAPAITTGLVAGLILGVVGAIPPGIRALRMPIPEALKAT